MNEPSPSRHAPVAPLRELGFIAVSIGAGLLLALVLLGQVVIPVVGFPGDLQRLVLLDQRLGRAPQGVKRVVLVSNSVGVEGIEASAVWAALGDGFLVENQASNGLDLLSGRLYIGRVLRSQPDALVWILRPELMGRVKAINPEVASAMRMAGFTQNADWINDAPPGLDESMLARLNAHKMGNSLSLRTIPLRHLNETVRIRARKGILPAKPLDTDAPYQIDTQLGAEKLARHIGDVTASYHERTGGGNREGLGFIEQTVAQIDAASALPVLVIAPTHPDATDFTAADAEFVRALREISDRTGAPVIDLSGLLGADEFADAIHPNRAGAAHLSAALGRALAPILNQAGRGG